MLIDMEKPLIPPDIVQPVIEILSYVFAAFVGWITGKTRRNKQIKQR